MLLSLDQDSRRSWRSGHLAFPRLPWPLGTIGFRPLRTIVAGMGYPRTFYTDLNRLICKTKPAVRAFGPVAHRITSSAWKRTEGGMVRPSAWAVLRLMTSSNVVGCSTGRSAGMVPFKILST
jgi:hypothetical protein